MGEFKDATEKEFEIAKKSKWFADMLLKWWEKDKKLSMDFNDDMRKWEGTEKIVEWCRNTLENKK